MVQPCASTIARQMDRPTPIPLALVDTNGSNSRSLTVLARPGPVSLTRSSAKRPTFSAATSIRRVEAFWSASTLLRIRLVSTWPI